MRSVPFHPFLGLVPCNGLGSDSSEMGKLPLTFVVNVSPLDVDSQMLFLCDADEIFDVVVGWVSIVVMDDPSFRDWTVDGLPNRLVEHPDTSSNVSSVRRVIAAVVEFLGVGVSSEGDTLENDDLDAGI